MIDYKYIRIINNSTKHFISSKNNNVSFAYIVRTLLIARTIFFLGGGGDGGKEIIIKVNNIYNCFKIDSTVCGLQQLSSLIMLQTWCIY